MANADSFPFPWVTPALTLEVLHSPTYRRFRQKDLEVKQKPKSHVYEIRHCCDIIGCAVTFARSYDLIRHKRTVHGPKIKCPYPQCCYATARGDKMKEHKRKKHFEWSKLINNV
jgi:hypothetical protein